MTDAGSQRTATRRLGSVSLQPKPTFDGITHEER
jgi:hypothetical protein